MTRTFWFCLSLTLLAISGAQAVPAPKKVVINVGDISDITGQSQANPLRRLVKSLKQAPSNSQIRLIWDDYAGNFGTKATALYDRKTRTLKFYSDTSIGGFGNEEVSNEIKSWIFGGVTEAMLNKLERKHRGALDGSDGASYFTELGYYGAKKRDLGSRQVLSKFGKSLRLQRNH